MSFANNNMYNMKIAVASKSASEWTTSNPVLLKGELGIETDTLKMKIGNGSTSWINLAYIDENIQATLTELTARVEYLEELAMAIMETTTSIIQNIMRGEENV